MCRKFQMRSTVSREKRMAKVDKREWKTCRILVGGRQDNYLNLNKQQEVSAKMWQTGNCHALLR